MCSNEITNVLRDIQTHTDGLKLLKRFLDNNKIHWTVLKYEKTGDSILHIAARLGLTDIILYLLNSEGVKYIDYKNKDAKTPLHEAAQFSQSKSIEILLQYGADVNALKRADWTPLMLACTKCSTNSYLCVDLLVKTGALVNFQNKDGWTALHLICREGDINILDLLISCSANINRMTKNGRSALHIASLHGHLSIIEKLISLGLDANLKDACGNTPILEAVMGGHIDICKFLNVYSDFTTRNNADLGALHLAASVGDLQMIKYLVECINIDVDIKNNSNLTPIHCAARKKHLEAVTLLTALGANVETKDSFGRCPNDYFNNI